MNKVVKTVNDSTFIKVIIALAAVYIVIVLLLLHETRTSCLTVRSWDMPIARQSPWKSRSKSGPFTSPELQECSDGLLIGASAFAPSGQDSGWRVIPAPLNGISTPMLFANISAIGVQPELAKFAFTASNH